jgi:hypothetical protein
MQTIKRLYMLGYTLMKVNKIVPVVSVHRNCIVTRRGLCVTYKRGSGLDDWIY